MKYLQFTLLFLIALTIIYKSSWFEIGVKRKYLLLIFSLKILIGATYTFLYANLFQATNVDVFNYFNDSAIVYDVLIHHTNHFWDLFTWVSDPVPPHLQVYFDQTGYLSNWGDFTIIRLHAIFRLITGGFIYSHIICFNLLSFIGLSYFYKFFRSICKGQSVRLFLCIYLFPSLLIFGSGLHKEGIVFFALGLIFYHFNQLILSNFKVNLRAIRSILIVFVSIVLLGFTRHYVLFSLLLIFTAWFLTDVLFKKNYTTFLLLFIGLIGSTLLLPDAYNWMELIIAKRMAFQGLDVGNSTFEMWSIKRSFSDIYILFEALYNGMLRPSVYPYKTFFNAFFAILNIFYLISFIYFVFIRRIGKVHRYHLISITFGIALLMLYGLVVNNEGALARYKSQVWFLLVPVLATYLPRKIEEIGTIIITKKT